MNDFLQTVLTFPTLIWTVLFAFCAVYWLIAATGLVGHHHADGHLGHTGANHVGAGPHVHHVDAGHAHGAHGHVVSGQVDGHHHADQTEVGLLARLGLDGVPLTLMLTLLSFAGWVVTYFVHLLLLSRLPGVVGLPLGLATLLGSLVVAVLITNVSLRPLRPLFARLDTPDTRSLIGATGVVTSFQVNATSGVASVEDGGAGLLLQVRAQPPNQPKRGERVVLIAYNAAENSYLVIPEDQF